MNKKNKITSILLILCMAAMAACNLPSGAPTEAPAAEASPTSTPSPAEIASATPVASATTCSPLITTNTDSNVRSGPGQVYSVLGQIPLGGTAPVVGKNFDGTWWYIQFAGSYGWISGSITTATCIPVALAVIAAPPTPIIPTDAPTNTSAPAPTSPPSPTPTINIVIPTFSFPTICVPLFGC